jgi:hypothetical protein
LITGYTLVCETLCYPRYGISWVTLDDTNTTIPELMSEAEAKEELADLIEMRRDNLEPDCGYDEEDLDMGYWVQFVGVDGDDFHILDEAGRTVTKFNWKELL